jgi:ABC-type cobalamin/Fe3+-siderophores transport system ATPase subunit/ribosomal protein S18 acetylase RimI-like enzyme
VRKQANIGDLVAARIRRGATTELRLQSGAVVPVRPFAPVGEGDRVLVAKNGRDIKIVLDDGEGQLDLSSQWSTTYHVDLGQEHIDVTVKEVETDAELAALTNLKQFHYRGEKTAGRAVPLIAVTAHRLLPEVIGFIEITSAMLVNTARKRVLDRPFADAERKVYWQRWDMNTAKRHTKRLARISRCVIYPELRGLGMASKLANAAVIYARDRWQFGGSQAVFLEITADMLRYAPFVASAGFTYVGDTEGNEERMLRDMRYLLKRTITSGSQDDFPQGGGGIMSLQRSYATMLLGVMNRRNIGLEQLLNLLRRSPESLTDDEWIALHRVFRRPKPTYMYGLTSAAKKHLHASAPIARQSLAAMHTVRTRVLPLGVSTIKLNRLSLHTSVAPAVTPRSRKVAEAFGIVAKRVDAALITDLSLEVLSGDVVLVTGPSGTGKSVLLRALHASLTGTVSLPDGVAVHHGGVAGPHNVSWVTQVDLTRAPVDLLEHVSLERALSLLGVAGLAESSLFVRPAATLSDGQKYRLSIACALAQEPQVLLVDAFCESLDDLAAAAVCKGLRSLSRRTGVVVIAAAASPDRLLPALQPDTVVQLLPGRAVRVHKRPSSHGAMDEDQEGSNLVKVQG